ncbi:hypothetical protein BC936DRAFT_144353 [Jimgerdemannia flammicorona]|uniref:CRAL-TRIO domain-containing protein n=1 Tax=Jimgerdemannia flammicorona TaxID=994334 RepID=A0A433DCK3_9FUNG|nr:hypothetical protein BC936DRAFT_144353 [Jimgerdemannia flammicorona]
MEYQKQKLSEYNRLFKHHKDDIDKLSTALKRELPNLCAELELDPTAISKCYDYVSDRVTLFRYLKRARYSLPTAQSSMLSTVRWRIENNIDSLYYRNLPREFFSSPLFFFHKTDRLQRPIALLNLQYLPKFNRTPVPTDADDEHEEEEEDGKCVSQAQRIRRFAMLVLEMVRKLTWDLTRERERRGDPEPLVMQFILLVDLKTAGFLAVDTETPQVLFDLIKNWYPSCIGSVLVLNFGWMYQSIWQMTKLLLNEEARSRVAFPTKEEMTQYVDKEDLLPDFGGTDDYEYTLATDMVLQTYGVPSDTISPASLVNLIPASSTLSSLDLATPPITPLSSPLLAPRHRSDSLDSLSSLSFSEYYDAVEFLPPTPFYTPLQTPYSSPRLVPYTGVTPIPQQIARGGLGINLTTITGLSFDRMLRSSRHAVTTLQSTIEIVPAAIGVSASSLVTRLTTLATQQNDGSHPHTSSPRHHAKHRHNPIPHAVSDPRLHRHHASGTIPALLRTLFRIEHRTKRVLARYLRASTRFNGLLYWLLVYLVVRGGLLDELLRVVVDSIVRLSVVGVRRGLLMGGAGVGIGIGVGLNNHI